MNTFASKKKISQEYYQKKERSLLKEVFQEKIGIRQAMDHFDQLNLHFCEARSAVICKTKICSR